ncbi:EF-hand domain-containing protein [Novosphingobium sp. 9]|uniref:EF-hand domain-containing protein n=1 Tax=Novosphingobium sp. 9 TaxID=2025349 RepID=UPI0021B6924A|nr:EF-hand domain-containing protein [Novosphingobium sp. 9]
MNRVILGALGALALVSLGLFWWQSKAAVERLAPPALPSAPPPDPMDLPSADDDALANIEGPDLPVASELSREQKRFARYDRDRDGRVSRAELLSTRTAAFRKLDKDGNNLLTFEEWAVTTVDKFQGADSNHDLYLTPTEFRSTAPPKPKPKLQCACGK